MHKIIANYTPYLGIRFIEALNCPTNSKPFFSEHKTSHDFSNISAGYLAFLVHLLAYAPLDSTYIDKDAGCARTSLISDMLSYFSVPLVVPPIKF